MNDVEHVLGKGLVSAMAPGIARLAKSENKSEWQQILKILQERGFESQYSMQPSAHRTSESVNSNNTPEVASEKDSTMNFSIPADIDKRPIAVIGAGTLGRRIALMMSSQGGEVRLFDKVQHSREEGVKFVEETLPLILRSTPNSSAAKVDGTADLAAAIDRAWLVFESVPERLDLKIELFGTLDSVSAPDAILASNSSSYPSSQFISSVKRPERVLNTHFYMPPDMRAVELMSCGRTDPQVIDLLTERFPHYGLVPFHVRKESVGFIFNRIWAAIKRESLLVVAEGVSEPTDVDRLFTLFTGGKFGPFRNMDSVGLDVVLDIEEHYASTRPGIPDGPRELLRSYLAKGWAGSKSGRGFYDDYSAKKRCPPILEVRPSLFEE